MGGVLQRDSGYTVVTGTSQEWPGKALGCEVLGSGQRDRRPVATGPQERRRLCQVCSGGGQSDEAGRRIDQVDRLGFIEFPPRLGLDRLESYRSRTAQD